MYRINKNLHKKINHILMAIFVLSLLLQGQPAYGANSEETPEAVFSGTENASILLQNLDFNDVKNSNTWGKEAIYESGALNLMKGYGSKKFGLSDTLSKEQAIAVIYRLIGREADAQKASEALNRVGGTGAANNDALAMWSKGYLQLAANDGLVTAAELKDALSEDQSAIAETGFHKTAPAQRQEIATWLAKALKLPPVYDQQSIFNSFSDWKLSDEMKIPYIEAILQNKIMNGDGAGKFNPTQSVTREQASQIVKNAEAVVFPLIKYEKRTGSIQDILKTNDQATGESIAKGEFNIRNDNGKLHRITTQTIGQPIDPSRYENNGNPYPKAEKELIVYKNGQIGSSELLSKGDRIEYIIAPENVVKFVKVLSNTMETKYIAAQIMQVDEQSLTITVSMQYLLEYPEISALSNDALPLGNESKEAIYRVSNNAMIMKENIKSEMSQLKAGTNAILTIKNMIVEGIQMVDMRANNQEKGIVNGIVEDNNPKLGYITLYNEDGSGVSPAQKAGLVLLRTYNYLNQDDIEVFKNHKKAKLEDIGVGDSVFLKTDEDANVVSISAVDNYISKYARVLSKKAASVTVEYEDGTKQILGVDASLIVIADKKISSYGSVKEGDRVKLLLDANNQYTILKEMTVEGNERFIVNIYKGTVAYIDDNSNKVVAENLEVLQNGQWVRTNIKGTSSIPLSESYQIFINNSEIDIEKANHLVRNNQAYVAVEKDYGGKERAVVIAYRNEDNKEIPYDDSIASVSGGVNEFNINKETNSIKYGIGTIVVKDDRLVSGNSISEKDKAYIIANRQNDTAGEYIAGVVKIMESTDTLGLQVYRGRIKQINENSDFTVESFSELKDLTWEYMNTPKTFTMKYDTRILDSEGVVSQRDFVGYGENSNLNTVVYIIANGTDAKLVDILPYGTVNASGKVLALSGQTVGETGTVLTQPTGITLRSVKTYDLSTRAWADSDDMTLTILTNSIILKGDKILKPSELQSGDKVRVLKADDTVTGDAYIIIVEN